ncbi:unnamed protein product [Auanema sp. JU1783]|nr:unnamed protein product [Auanema sp. JU1783]
MNCFTKRLFSSIDSGPNLIFRKAKVSGKSIEDLKSSKVIVPGFKGEALYGTSPVLEALIAGRRKIFKLYIKRSVKDRRFEDGRVSKILSLAEELKIPVGRLTQAQFDRKTNFQLHNGVCIDASSMSFSDFNDECQQLLFLDGVLDPGNIGAIARTAFYFGISQLVLRSSRCPNLITPVMSKASSGALEHMSVSKLDDEKLSGFTLIGTVEPGSTNEKVPIIDIRNFTTDQGKKLALVLGDEGEGMSPLMRSLCEKLVTIPRLRENSSVNSLNVSVAAGIFLYHLNQTYIKE